MKNNQDNTPDIISYYFGPSNTCAGKISRMLGVLSAFSLSISLSSTIPSSILYLYNSEKECPAEALSSLAITSSIITLTSLITAFCIGQGFCGSYDVYSSTTTSIPSISVSSPRSSYDIKSLITSDTGSPSINPSKLQTLP